MYGLLSGRFEAARQYAMLGAQIWRSGGAVSSVEEDDAPAVSCLFHQALSEWHLGDISSCHVTMAKAISLAKELNDIPSLAGAVFNSGILSHFERDVPEAERLASDVMELSTRHNFAFSWLSDPYFAVGRAALRVKLPKASLVLRTEYTTIGQPAQCLGCHNF
jgi:hypothetical protein